MRLGVLASGRGGNLEAVARAASRGRLPVRIVAVLSDRPQARALRVARRYGLPNFVVAPEPWDGCAAEAEMTRRLREAGAQLVLCAGWDRILGQDFCQAFAGRVLNLHPSLLPAFAGTMHALEEAWKAGVKVTGCTVHFVTPEVDAGPIIAQRAVPVREGDTLESLGARLARAEHRQLLRVLEQFASGRISLKGGRAVVVQ